MFHIVYYGKFVIIGKQFKLYNYGIIKRYLFDLNKNVSFLICKSRNVIVNKNLEIYCFLFLGGAQMGPKNMGGGQDVGFVRPWLYEF